MYIPHTVLRRVVPACSLALLSACHCLPRPAQCAHTRVQTLGVEDGFAPPEAAPVQSPALVLLMESTPTPEQGFDEAVGGHEFGASFRLGGGRLCTVRVEVAVRPGYPPHELPIRGGNNDVIKIGRAPFNSASSAPVFHRGFVWPAGSSGRRTLSIYLPVNAVQTYIDTADEPMIDLYIHDDTNVDFIRITETYR